MNFSGKSYESIPLPLKSKKMESVKTALITGGSRGLGRDMALRLAEKGADVIITFAGNKDEAQKTVETITKMGRKSTAMQLDLRDAKAPAKFAVEFSEILKDKFNGRFDYLINNAGMGATVPF